MQRSYTVLVVALAFLVGVGFMSYKILSNSKKWIQDPQNMHIPKSEAVSEESENERKEGNIVDRTGTVLAYTDDNGVRRYHDDASVRKALLHLVGDKSLNISTAIQSMYRANLAGYSFLFGMGLPDSIKGNLDFKLTVDADACRAAYEAMEGYNGACIIYNYKTGEVLCSVSNPTYDPEDPPEITEENAAEYDGVYLDNVMSSTYTPGSTFKIITAASAIENIPDIYSRTFHCTGSYEVLGKEITCLTDHGDLTFEEALTHSCNCAFAQMAIEIGDKKLKATAEEFGFNHKGYTLSGIPLAQSTYDAVGAGDNYLAWSGVGQYTDLANPAHMAMICGAIANGGTAVSPYFVEDDGSLFGKLGISNNKAGNVDMVSSGLASKVRELMSKTGERYRSEDGVYIAGLDFCAKTGTAEVGGDEYGNKKTNAWFVGFIEDERYPYAFAVVRQVLLPDGEEVDESYGRASSYVINAAISELVYKDSGEG